MNGFLVKINQKQHGPMSVRELKDVVTKGNAHHDVFVWDDTLGDWVSARRLTEIQSAANVQDNEYQPKILAFAGGKGGVGKTVLSTNVGVALASMGSEVILVDGDLAGPDLHTCMGIVEPQHTFFDFYTLAKDSLQEIVLETPVKNLGLISGACGSLGVANPKYQQKQRLIRELKKLQADYVVLDLGAGASYNVVDFFLQADDPVIVVSPEPTSVHEAFGFLKICMMRELARRLKGHSEARDLISSEKLQRPGRTEMTAPEMLTSLRKVDVEAFETACDFLAHFKPRLVLNMVKSRKDTKEALALGVAVQELLAMEVETLGTISFDPRVSESVKARKPLLLFDSKCKASQDLAELVRTNLLGRKGFKESRDKRAWRKQLALQSAEFPDVSSI